MLREVERGRERKSEAERGSSEAENQRRSDTEMKAPPQQVTRVRSQAHDGGRWADEDGMSEHRRRVNTGNTQVTHPLVGDDIIEQLPSVTELHDQVDLFRRVHDLMEVHLGGRGRGQKDDKSRVGKRQGGKRQGGKRRVARDGWQSEA